ncbi:MAG: hypothetical protein ACTTH5_04250 [Wolinella sp.]
MKRQGFGIIYAILVLLAISTLLAFSFNFSTNAYSTSVAEHTKIQLRLYEKSALELAILELQNSSATNSRMLNERVFDGGYRFKIHATQLSDDISAHGAIYRLDLIGTVTPPGWEYKLSHTITSRHIVKP